MTRYLVAPSVDFDVDGNLVTLANALFYPTSELSALLNGTAYRAYALSDPSDPFVPLAPPVNTVLPAISAIPTVGQVATSDLGTWTGTEPITYARQWRRNGTPISGATGTTYTFVTADLGATITVAVTATNGADSATAVSDPTAAITSGAPTYVVGDFEADDGLTMVSVVADGENWIVTVTDGVTPRAATFTGAQMAAYKAGSAIGYIYRNVAVSGGGSVTTVIWAFAAVSVDPEFTYQGYVGTEQDPSWTLSTFDASTEANWQLLEIGVIVTPNIGSPFTIVGQAVTYAAFVGPSGADLIETDVDIGGVLWDFHHFRTPGTFTPTFTAGYAEAEIIGAGGEAARSSFSGTGGGSGAGRYVPWAGVLPAGAVTLTVAAALTPLTLGTSSLHGRKGNSSFFNGEEAEGGGGGRARSAGNTLAKDGGSGGGAHDTVGSSNPGQATVDGVGGHDGGEGLINNGGGGGGGAGGVGGNASTGTGGNGGPGILSLFTGTPRPVCAGGAGTGVTTPGTGGTHGGGNAGASGANGADGTTPGSGAGAARSGGVNVRPGVGFRGEIVVKVKAVP